MALGVFLVLPLPAKIQLWVDEVRQSTAALVSRPAEALVPLHGSRIICPKPVPYVVDEYLAGPTDSRDEIPVIWSSRTALVIGAGWKEGLRKGQTVASGDHFLGFVDRVEEGIARVRLAHHRGANYGAEILGRDGEIEQSILLTGDGSWAARPRAGHLIDASSRGRWALRPHPLPLKVGKVALAEGHLHVDLSHLDTIGDFVRVHSIDDGVILATVPTPLFEALKIERHAEGRALAGAFATQFPYGSQDGVSLGDPITWRGRLVGTVTRLGRHHARWDNRSGDGGLSVQDPFGSRCLRGRSHRAAPPWPRGLQVPRRGDRAFAFDAESYWVHRFLYRDAFRRLLRGQR